MKISSMLFVALVVMLPVQSMGQTESQPSPMPPGAVSAVMPKPSKPEGITITFTEQELAAVVDLLNDGVKFAGLPKAQTAGYLYEKIQKAVTAHKQPAPKGEDK